MSKRTLTEMAAVWPPTAQVAAEAGHEPMSPMRAIRLKCLDCSVYQHSEIKLCEATGCALWPFRAGRHPYTQSAMARAADNSPVGSDFNDEANVEVATHPADETAVKSPVGRGGDA